MLAIPTLRPWVERNVHRRAVALASHVQSGPIGSLLPRDLRFACCESAADVVGNLLRKRCARVNRPAAEIERLDVPSQSRETCFRKQNLPPTKPRHGVELRGFKLDRRQIRRQRLVEPYLDAFVEHRVDLAASKRLQAANVRWSPAKDEPPAP